MKRVATVFFFPNGNIAALDENGEQIADLQKMSAIDLFSEKAWSMGYSLKGCLLKIGDHELTIGGNGEQNWTQK